MISNLSYIKNKIFKRNVLDNRCWSFFVSVGFVKMFVSTSKRQPAWAA